MQKQQIDVSTKNGPSVTVQAPLFERPEDFKGRIESYPTDSKVVFTDEQAAVLRDVVGCAGQQWIVKVQGRARGKLDDKAEDKGKAAVQKIVDEYTYSRRGESAPKIVKRTISKKVKFTPDQLAALREQGVEIELA